MIGTMIAHDVVVTGFHKQEGNLETLFMRVTEGNDGIEGDGGIEGNGGTGGDGGIEGDDGGEGDGGGESNGSKTGKGENKDVAESDC